MVHEQHGTVETQARRGVHDPGIATADTSLHPSVFDQAYVGTPPWDIEGPQPAFVGLADSGKITGTVLDIGCGTGENALFLTERGHAVLGVDLSGTAIRRAREKAAQRGLT